jgi:small-conductance mechanosensitive channel
MTALDQIQRWLDQHNANVLVTATLLLVAFVAILLINRVLRSWLRLLGTRIALPYATVLALTRIISGLLWLMTVLIVLDVWGVGISGLWTLLISAATVIGVGFLATWAMVSNVTASFFLTLWRPFQFGDTVELLPDKDSVKGKVIDRNLMFTALRDDDGSITHVPNNLFFQKAFRVSGTTERFLYADLKSPAAERTVTRAPAE